MPSIKLIAALIGMSITLASASPRIPQGASSIGIINPPVDDTESHGEAKRACSAITLYGAQDTIITSKCDVLPPTCTPCVGCNAPQCEGVIDVVTEAPAQRSTPTPVEKVDPTSM